MRSGIVELGKLGQVEEDILEISSPAPTVCGLLFFGSLMSSLRNSRQSSERETFFGSIARSDLLFLFFSVWCVGTSCLSTHKQRHPQNRACFFWSRLSFSFKAVAGPPILVKRLDENKTLRKAEVVIDFMAATRNETPVPDFPASACCALCCCCPRAAPF